MSEIIDFNEIKNKVKEQDVDKFEDYVYSMYYKMESGSLNMGEFSQNIVKYMQENNISQEKFIQIQKKILERYGLDPENFEKQIKMAGIDLNSIASDSNYQSIRKAVSFKEKYDDKVKDKQISEYFIKNDKNDIKIVLDGENVFIISDKNIDIKDVELNEFLCSYKKVRKDKMLKINICENKREYNY
ncbi:DUF3867 domain-containing protein [Clostridium sp. BJN0001]|uniref:DUF3867 domain-containing protein n=1 Tax=Clostridium sp. BJN0001 TaxID=2930219 RepID=UPI001FD14152|nr:DUF3867 domain-containing protein [Clostridium sp. BJN0001]